MLDIPPAASPEKHERPEAIEIAVDKTHPIKLYFRIVLKCAKRSIYNKVIYMALWVNNNKTYSIARLTELEM
jgi:hypothetical protein